MKNNVMLNLKQKLDVLESAIDGRNVIYIDYPIHTNGGDLLIFLGTMAFFRNRKVNVLASYSCHNCDLTEIESLLTKYKNTCIVLHGGGNFGDLYVNHQSLRTQIFTQFKDERILLFPQTAHYEAEQNLDKDRQLISTLTNAHFFARDQQTLDLFNSMGVGCELCPDIAHELYGEFPSNSSKLGNTLNFIRQDKEKKTTDKHYENAVDWINLLSWTDKKIMRVIVRWQKKSNSLSQLSFKLWYWYADKIMKKLAIVFQQHETIITSRLHGHIFSCLLDRQNLVLDNIYGKNSRYISHWTKNIEYLKNPD
jgi:exopolysaccharide biosynthesis predicted pyruvyltransferase EpsI